MIAQYDMLRAELPDVFSFARRHRLWRHRLSAQVRGGTIHPGRYGSSTAYDYVLPLGAGAIQPVPPVSPAPGAVTPGTGIHGASYTAAAGIYKNLGYMPGGI